MTQWQGRDECHEWHGLQAWRWWHGLVFEAAGGSSTHRRHEPATYGNPISTVPLLLGPGTSSPGEIATGAKTLIRVATSSAVNTIRHLSGARFDTIGQRV